MEKHHIRYLNTRCQDVLIPIDFLPRLPFEITSIIFAYLDIPDILGCLDVSSQWKAQLGSPAVLRQSFMRYFPRDRSELQNLSGGELQKLYKRMENFRNGKCTYEIEIPKSFTSYESVQFGDESWMGTQRVAFSWPKLAAVRNVDMDTSFIEMTTIMETGQSQYRTYYGDERETFQCLRCSSTLLVGISSLFRCYVWNHEKNVHLTTFRIEPGSIEAVDVSDSAIVILQECLRVTTWSLGDMRVLQFLASMPDHGAYKDHEILLDATCGTFLHFSHSTQYLLAQRLDLTGATIARSQRKFLWQEFAEDPSYDPSDDSCWVCTHNRVQRQPHNKYIVWSLFVQGQPLPLTLIGYDPACSEFFIKEYKFSEEQKWIRDLIVLNDVAYLISEDDLGYAELNIIRLDGSWPNNLRERIGLSDRSKMLLGDERLLLQITTRGYTARWFDEDTKSKASD